MRRGLGSCYWWKRFCSAEIEALSRVTITSFGIVTASISVSLRLQPQSFCLSVVSQKRLTVKMFFCEILVDCNADLGIGRRLET